MDRDDFEQWLDNPITRKVFAKVREDAERIEESLKETLVASIGIPAGDWSDLQGRAGIDRGIVTGISHVVNITYEEMTDGEPERDSPDGVQVPD